jgi:hypothetical protein
MRFSAVVQCFCAVENKLFNFCPKISEVKVNIRVHISIPVVSKSVSSITWRTVEEL